MDLPVFKVPAVFTIASQFSTSSFGSILVTAQRLRAVFKVSSAFINSVLKYSFFAFSKYARTSLTTTAFSVSLISLPRSPSLLSVRLLYSASSSSNKASFVLVRESSMLRLAAEKLPDAKFLFASSNLKSASFFANRIFKIADSVNAKSESILAEKSLRAAIVFSIPFLFSAKTLLDSDTERSVFLIKLFKIRRSNFTISFKLKSSCLVSAGEILSVFCLLFVKLSYLCFVSAKASLPDLLFMIASPS